MKKVLIMLVLATFVGVAGIAVAKPRTREGTHRADRIIGTPRNDVIRAKNGNDYVEGRGGDDRIQGQNGDDVIFGDSATSDPGVCHRDYGENDERESGRDEISSGPGNDFVDPGGEEDSVDTGPGNDTICAVDGEPDTIRCGPGDDTVTADYIDRVAADCEHVTRTGARRHNDSD